MKYDKIPKAMRKAKGLITNCNLENFEERYVPDLSEKQALVLGSKLYGDEKQDRRKRYGDALGLDMQDGAGVDIVADLEDYEGFLDDIEVGDYVYTNQFVMKADHIDCISVLEHVRRPWLAAETIEAFLNHNGTILISVPFAWRAHGYPSDYWRYTTEAIKVLFPNIEWQKLCYMCSGVEVTKAPSVETDYGTFYGKTEVLGFGVKK